MRDEFAIVAAPKTKWHYPGEVSATGLLIGLRLPDTLTDAIALGLSKGRAAIVREQLGQTLCLEMSPPMSSRCPAQTCQ